MTTNGTRGLAGSLPVRVLRRALAPAALEFGEQVRATRVEVDALRATVARLTEDNADLRRRIEAGPGLAEVGAELTALRSEVADLVTELVLPLHDRQVDPAVLGRLRPDTM